MIQNHSVWQPGCLSEPLVLIVRPKIAELNLFLFGRSLHPELFVACAHRRLQRDQYTLDVSITSDGHLLVFQHDGLIISEVSAGTSHPLPERRMLMQHSIQERAQQDQLLFRDNIAYECDFQRDVVAAEMIVAIQQQVPNLASDSLIHRFQTSGRIPGGAVSYIGIQAFHQHVQVRSFHTFPETRSIVRSRSVFRLYPSSNNISG